MTRKAQVTLRAKNDLFDLVDTRGGVAVCLCFSQIFLQLVSCEENFGKKKGEEIEMRRERKN
jgi:hypothetical protein